MNYSDSSACYDSSASASCACDDNQNKNVFMPDRDFNYVPADASERAVAKGGVACPFPWRLHEMLKVSAEEGLEHVVSWAPHGKAFTVHRPQEFAESIMPRFFCQTKFASFQRQLNLYGFSRFCHGRDKGAYYHSAFVRGERALVRQMIRRKIKGSAATLRRPLPCEEPNFYQDGDNEPAVAATVSPIPPFISYQSCSRTISRGDEQQEQQQPVVSPAVTTEEEQEDDDNLAFFAGSPFHFIQHEQEPAAVSNNSITMQPLDPAAELAKIRAQIRQKQAEYEQTVGRRHQPVLRRVSWQQQQQQQQQPFKRRQVGSSIPVYKGSYIAV